MNGAYHVLIILACVIIPLCLLPRIGEVHWGQVM